MPPALVLLLMAAPEHPRIFSEVGERWMSGLPPALVQRLRGPPERPAATGVVVVDLDADGFDDLFVWDERGPAALLRNADGRRLEVFARPLASGLERANVSGAAFADLDDDGRLDVVLARRARRTEVAFGGPKGFSDSGLELPPDVTTVAIADVNGDGRLDVFLGPPNVLLVNLGARRFADATHRLELDTDRIARQASFADFDGDGLVDLFVGYEGAPPSLYVNERGRFRDAASKSNAAKAFFGSGALWTDADVDGDLDLAGARGTRRLVNAGRGRFTVDVLHEDAIASEAFGASLVDADGDGREELFFPGRGLSAHEEIGPGAGAAAPVDLDRDGDEDLVVLSSSRAPSLAIYENRREHRDFVTFEIAPDPIGATVWITCGSRTIRRDVREAGRRTTVGLGDCATIDRLRVRYPGGDDDFFDGIEASRAYRVTPNEPLSLLELGRPPVVIAAPPPADVEPSEASRLGWWSVAAGIVVLLGIWLSWVRSRRVDWSKVRRRGRSPGS